MALGKALARLHDGDQVHGGLGGSSVLLRDSDGAVVGAVRVSGWEQQAQQHMECKEWGRLHLLERVLGGEARAPVGAHVKLNCTVHEGGLGLVVDAGRMRSGVLLAALGPLRLGGSRTDVTLDTGTHVYPPRLPRCNLQCRLLQPSLQSPNAFCPPPPGAD